MCGGCARVCEHRAVQLASQARTSRTAPATRHAGTVALQMRPARDSVGRVDLSEPALNVWSLMWQMGTQKYVLIQLLTEPTQVHGLHGWLCVLSAAKTGFT